MKFPPSSMYLSKTARATCSSEPQPHSVPNVIVPRQNGLTRSPDRPSVTYESTLLVILFSFPVLLLIAMEKRSLLPAATQRLVKLDQRQQLIAFRLTQIKLRIK